MTARGDLVAAVRSLPTDRVPGDGATGARWLALFDLAAAGDVSGARLCEAHLDATAILAEAGQAPRPGALYGVWASVRPDGRDVELVDGSLRGVKSFASGVGLVDRALIEVMCDGRRQLVDAAVAVVPVGDRWHSDDGRRTATIDWHNQGLVATNTGTVCFDAADDVETVGPPDWYLERPGFWHGACGPAACWGGGAAGLVSERTSGGDPHRLAAAGAIEADVWSMRALLRQAGDEADRTPDDLDAARWRARALRHAIHELATGVVDTFMRAYGPRPMVEHGGAGRRIADVQLYLRQHHGRADLEALAAGT